MTVSNSEKQERWLSPREAGERLPGNLAPQTVRDWCSKGWVPGAVRLPNGRWQIPESSVEKLANGEGMPT